MKNLFTILLIAASLTAFAQKASFRSHNSIGLLEGERGGAVLVESVNGISFGTWFAGVGIAFDHYTFRSIPAYVQLRKELSVKKPVYFFFSAGENIPWVKRTMEDARWEPKFRPGFYYEGGVGYRVILNSKNSLLFSAGYSQKKMDELRPAGFCITWPCPQTNSVLEHRLRSLVLKAGIRF